jgi:hypothetical protein
VVYGEYPTGGQYQGLLENALAKIRYQNWITVPMGVKLQVLDTAGSAADVLATLCRDLREEISMSLQGAILSHMTGGGAQRGDSSVHSTRSNLFAWFLASLLSNQVFNNRKNGLVRKIVEPNFRNIEELPILAVTGIDEKELSESLSIDSGLQGLGWKLGIDEMEDRYGRTYCEQTDNILLSQEQIRQQQELLHSQVFNSVSSVIDKKLAVMETIRSLFGEDFSFEEANKQDLEHHQQKLDDAVDTKQISDENQKQQAMLESGIDPNNPDGGDGQDDPAKKWEGKDQDTKQNGPKGEDK